MAFSFTSAAFLVCVVVLLPALQSAEARTLIRHMPAAAAAVGSSTRSASSGHNRRLLAAPGASAAIVSAKSAPLPADILVTASACPATVPAPGSTASATFIVAAPVAPQLFKEVSLQVDFPKALWPAVSLSCMTSTSQVITCDAPKVASSDLLKYDIMSTACLLGDLAATGPVTCTFSYTMPSAPLAPGVDARQILAAVTYADLAANVVEDTMNNAATTCVPAS